MKTFNGSPLTFIFYPLLALAALLLVSGCPATGTDDVIDLGEFVVNDINQLTPGDAPAMKRLAAEVTAKPQAKVLAVKWKNMHAVGDTYRREYTYDREAHTLTDDANRRIFYYTGVTDEMIASVAAANGTADMLLNLGAQRSASPPQ